MGKNYGKWWRGVELSYLNLNGLFSTIFKLHAPIMAEKGFWITSLVRNYLKQNGYSCKMRYKMYNHNDNDWMSKTHWHLKKKRFLA